MRREAGEAWLVSDMEAIDSGSQSQWSQSSQGGWEGSQGSQQQDVVSGAGADGLLTTGEYALAYHRWMGEVAAAGTALERRGVEEGEAGRQDAYVRMLDPWRCRDALLGVLTKVSVSPPPPGVRWR